MGKDYYVKPVALTHVLVPGNRYQELPNSRPSNTQYGYRLPIVPMKPTKYWSPKNPPPEKVIIKKLCIRFPEFNLGFPHSVPNVQRSDACNNDYSGHKCHQDLWNCNNYNGYGNQNDAWHIIPYIFHNMLLPFEEFSHLFITNISKGSVKSRSLRHLPFFPLNDSQKNRNSALIDRNFIKNNSY